MKYFKIIGILLLTIIVGLVIFIVYTPGKKNVFNPGPEFEYSALTDVKNGQYEKFREYILLKDSNKIAVTYLVPTNTDNEKMPTILAYSPYTTSLVVPQMSWFKRIASKYYFGKWGPVYEKMSFKTINTLTSNGYVLVFADMRGTGSSTGHSGPFDPIFIDDAGEILEWIANQSWSNAKIGMIGQSYQGWSQFAAASTQSPYLKCIAPEMIFYNLYEEAVRPGGIYAQEWTTEYSKGTVELNNRNLWNSLYSIPSYPSEPVIDEDQDGDRIDEIPILKENDLNSYAGELLYADGNERPESPYIALTKEHDKNLWPREIAFRSQYTDDTLEYFGRKVALSDNSIDYLIDKLKKTKIPVLLTGGFFDGFSRGMVQSFVNLQETNPVYLFMAPRFHIPADITKQYQKLFDVEYAYPDQLLSMQLQFFDKYLKEIDNELDAKPPAKVYTAFEGWRYYETWPPITAKYIKYHIGLNNELVKELVDDVTYDYDIDFTHSSSYNEIRTNPQLMVIFNDSLMIRNQHDKKCVVFETEVLIEDVLITGSPIANLRISSNQVNADVFVYLSDVDSAGVVHYVTEGKLRAGWHNLYDNNESINGLYDVKPELPWHSYKRENYDHEPFANDSIVNLRFELKPHAWKFQKGHKIRMSIAGADNINYEFNPAISPDNTIENCKPTKLNIHTGKTHQSYLELPVIN
ncbi:MAG: CocE/NonD family hydrolase [Bacteroidota bacterium]